MLLIGVLVPREVFGAIGVVINLLSLPLSSVVPPGKNLWGGGNYKFGIDYLSR